MVNHERIKVGCFGGAGLQIEAPRGADLARCATCGTRRVEGKLAMKRASAGANVRAPLDHRA